MINKQNLLWQAFGLLPFLCLVACSTDDAPGSGTGAELVPVTIRLDVENSGLQTRAGSADTDNIDDDAINSLDVYIVDASGQTERHLTRSNFNGNVATTTLWAGTKRIYAVANVGTDYSSAVPQNASLNATTLISANNGIPMSTTQDTTWNVTASQPTYDVRLNRMVGRVDVTLKDERDDKTKSISSVSISGLPTTTNLYREEYKEIILPTNVDMGGTWSWKSITMTNNSAFNSFYLHETNEGGTVKVQVGNDERTGRFSSPIPRNHILPLFVHITDFSLVINGSYTYAPIGVQPINVKIKDLSSYQVSLPEGSSDITLTIQLKKNTSGGSDITNGVDWTCTLPPEADIYFNDNSSETNATLTLTADAIPALSGDNWVIPITAAYEGKNYQFSLTIAVVGLDEIRTRSGAGKQPEGPVIIEL